jgi:hypothetical protein
MKKSGLADSPFFEKPKTREVKHPNKLNKRVSEQTNERSNVQVYGGSDVQMNKHTNVQGYRSVVRRSYDIYLDQVDKIDEQAIKSRRLRGKNVTKGEVMREIIDYFFKQNS